MSKIPGTESTSASPVRAAALCAFALACIGIIVFGYVQAVTTFRDSESYSHRMAACEGQALDRLGLVGAQHPDIATLDNVGEHCYNDILYADKLGESTIRRGMYIHQRYENNVILFMVVLITLAGVVLAGLQLLTSYKLAATGQAQGEGATELSLAQGKLSIRSSVTGLIVLALSLAFFFVYVLKVYNIDPQTNASPSSGAGVPSAPPDSPPAAANQPVGGNGSPP